MSKHVPRKSRWTRINAREHRSAFGVVQYRAGAWEGTVVYQMRTGETEPWQDEAATAGRFKRPRNAMISVEDKAREIARRFGENVKIALAD